ncbi:MAG TPA: sulfurtransferase [Alphaproteobacteria bacterium]|nr:sulfurtransferase [Alphaproteobacteria bacterium]
MKKFFAIALALAMVTAAGAVKAATPLVDVAWVKANLGKPGVVFLDVGGKLGGKTKADFLRAHVPGAVWTNYLKDGWRYKDKNNTVGQLSPTPKLEKLIGGLGIGNKDHVVIIPVGGKALDVATATRIYWTFKVLGHDNVSVLNGGMNAYKKAKNPLQSGASKPKAKTFKANFRKAMVIGKADVKKVMKAGGVLVDIRPHNQFLGVNKHGKAKRYGTIPGAKNLPENWMTKNGGGTFRSPALLKKLFAFAKVPVSGPEIYFCNSGHWASLGWFVSSELLGNKDAKMYDGSMIEWTADMSLPVQSAFKR